MKQAGYLLTTLLISLLLAACAGTERAAPQGPKGPALIMFYTDN